MNTFLKASFLILIGVFGATIAQSPKPAVNDFAWLAGCWEANRNGREINEQWMNPSGGSMLGMARTVANGKTIEYEFVQIREEQDGAIYYVAKPSGQPEASFKLVKLQNPKRPSKIPSTILRSASSIVLNPTVLCSRAWKGPAKEKPAASIIQ